MATENVNQGAKALIDLIDSIGVISNATCYLIDAKPEADTRDYKAMAAMVNDTLQAMMAADQDATVREGFVRAMTDLLCMTADGTGIGTDAWDPIGVTAAAFNDSAEVQHV